MQVFKITKEISMKEANFDYDIATFCYNIFFRILLSDVAGLSFDLEDNGLAKYI